VPARPFLRRVTLERERVPSFDRYPFALPVVRQLHTLELHPQVTYLIGDNGSGKSTLLEAIAVALGFNAEGGSRNFRFANRESHSELHGFLGLERAARPRTGFFFRAESYFNVATKIEELDRIEETEGVDNAGPPLTPTYGGRSLHEQSHGESFFALFLHRFTANGLYLLDEPEAALSVSRQLSFLTRLHELVQEGCQFLIATHSPILLAYPQALIYQLGDHGLAPVAYQDTDNFRLTRQFLDAPERMLRVLFGEEP
jgi:predicted ATPase